MDLKQLQALGAFVPTKPIKRTITVQIPRRTVESTWTDPEIPEYEEGTDERTIDVYVRKGSSADAIEMANAVSRSQPFVAIFRGVCNEDGSPVFESLEQAEQLETWIAVPLFEAISEVSGKRPKASAPKTNGGASSPSPSEAEASESGSKQ